MTKIVFVILDTASHLNASYKLAKALQSRGYSILYLSNPTSQTKIEGLGFEFFSQPESYQIEKIAQNTQSPKALKTEVETGFLSGGLFDDVIDKFDPALIVLDTSLIYFSVYLIGTGIPFITISTKVCQNKRPFIPPFNSDYIPNKNNIFSFLRVEWIWCIHLLRKKWRDFVDDKSDKKLSRFRLANRYLEERGLMVADRMVTQRSSHFGWKDIPEFILSPRHFDFPSTLPANQIHIGPVVELNRTEDKRNLQLFREIFDNKSKTIYCSMGSYDRIHRMDRINFFLLLINIFPLRKDIQLILGTGKDVDPEGFRPLPKNVYLFQHVPQLYVIHHANLVISHGGMQSITECILKETPMLIYPLNPDLDQKGNASRVVYHKIGLRGNIKSDTKRELVRKIDEILGSEIHYINNIKTLKQKMLESADFENGIQSIEQYIHAFNR